MPEMTLTSVDFPAPLSPTRPTTSPGMTRKSTPLSARTAPNRLVIPLTSRRGVVSVISGSSPSVRLLDSGCLTARRVAAGADLRSLPEPVLDDRVLDVVLRHRDGLEEDRRHVDLAVVGLAVDHAVVRLLAVEQVVRQLRGALGLRLDRLVDGHVLLAGDDALDAGKLGVLAGDRDLGRVDAVGLHRGDDATGVAVVGGVDADEAVLAQRGDRLLHLGLRLVRRPV